jgi:hypothetical protein
MKSMFLLKGIVITGQEQTEWRTTCIHETGKPFACLYWEEREVFTQAGVRKFRASVQSLSVFADQKLCIL